MINESIIKSCLCSFRTQDRLQHNGRWFADSDAEVDDEMFVLHDFEEDRDHGSDDDKLQDLSFKNLQVKQD